MTPFECEFEAEVLAAALQSRWDDELRAHVAGCTVCSDVATVAEAIEAGRESQSAVPAIPDSGRVWWLAQRRARLEAAEAANRPMTAAQVIATVCAVGLLSIYLPAMSTWLRSAMALLASGITEFNPGAWLASATSVLVEHGALALAMAAVLFLLPAAVYFAMGRD
jgi:hypothetical protein